MRTRRDDGFTLIELMIVVLIIAVLIAVAIPSMLGARRRAMDRHAQVNLRNAATAQLTYYTDALAFTDVEAELVQVQTYIDWVPAPPADARQNQVAVAVAGAGLEARVWMQSTSAVGNDFCIAVLDAGGVFFKSGAGCFADPTLTPVLDGWSSQGF